jgi:hypothetical protein
VKIRVKLFASSFEVRFHFFRLYDLVRPALTLWVARKDEAGHRLRNGRHFSATPLMKVGISAGATPWILTRRNNPA